MYNPFKLIFMGDESMFDIVGIDYPCVDLNINVDALPESNETILANNLSWQGGGKVASGIVTAARLGAKCAIAGAVGDDRYGSFCSKDFVEYGIDISFLKIREGAGTAFDIILSDRKTMGRSMIFHPGDVSRLEESELPFEYLKHTRYFFMAWLDAASRKAAEIARESGAKIFIDADTYSDELVRYIPQTDVFVASEFVYAGMFDNKNYEKNCRTVMDMGPEIVVFTLGEKGALGMSREGFFRIPAFDVEVVDTVGAGDDFHGAFLVGMQQKGWSVEKIAGFSSAVAAIKCTRIGGRAGIPDMQTVLHFMRTGEIQYSEIDKRVKYYERGMDYV